MTGSETRLVALLGHPVATSLSPAIHEAAFRASGRNARYLAFDVSVDRLAPALRGLAALGAWGANLTAPLKGEGFRLADESTPEARVAGAANTARFESGRILVHNTDGIGFVRFLALAGTPAAGRRVAILGAGGAAAGLAPALIKSGAAAVTLVARRPESATDYPGLDPRRGLEVQAWGSAGARAAITRAGLVVHCTPLGRSPDDPLPAPVAWLAPDAVVVDLRYDPAETPWIAAARARGLQAANGLGLLLEQAIASQEFWFGETPPRQALEEAVGWSGAFVPPRVPSAA